jgi:hypothetical protein
MFDKLMKKPWVKNILTVALLKGQFQEMVVEVRPWSKRIGLN